MSPIDFENMDKGGSRLFREDNKMSSLLLKHKQLKKTIFECLEDRIFGSVSQ